VTQSDVSLQAASAAAYPGFASVFCTYFRFFAHGFDTS
jgi:hypothetical protein